jgi:hypothetical protein
VATVYDAPPIAGRPLIRDDVLPPVSPLHGRRAWAAALVASVARTWWLAVVLATGFFAGALAAGLVRHQRAAEALGWGLAGAAVWLAVSAAGIALRLRR